MKAASMAGGFGTRLRPLTAHTVTPLVTGFPVGPTLQSHLPEAISRAREAGPRLDERERVVGEEVDLTCPRYHVVAKGEGAEGARALAEEFRGRMPGWRKELA